MGNPFVSIIVPIYNRENTLSYCVRSIINQQFTNWELLLIDDGSTDGSAELCKAFAKEDPRIKYVKQDNQGAGPARNNGIEHSTGEWITFVDSDDAIMPNHLTQLVKYGEGKDMVMVNHCQARYTNGVLEKISDYWNVNSVELEGNGEILDFIFSGLNPYQYYVYCCWDKFFSARVIKQNHIKFPTDIPTGQDMFFVVSYLEYTNKFYFSKEGTHTQIPMGNEAIEHLAWKLRPPKEYFHCHLRNYKNLINLYNKTHVNAVRRYAAYYVLTDTMERVILRYTNWRNRRIVGKKEILDFANNEFKAVIEENTEFLDCIQNKLYRNHFKKILKGKASEVYNYWFLRNNVINIYYAIKRRLT